MASYLKGIILLQFLLFDGVRYSVVAQVPDDTETWKGSNRIIALEDIHPFEKKKELRWVPGFMCGWTPYGLCFSPEWKRNIHYYFIIPFKNLYIDVYVDQPADPAVFGINSVVLTRFKQKPGYLWEGLVTTYWNGWDSKRKRTVPTSIQVRTDYHDLKEQLTEWFSPSQLRLKGAFDACKYLETNCQAGERCVSRRLSGYVWPGQYKCVCKDKGFLEIRGQGCFDVDECQKSPCGALSVCVNTFGSYKCNCKSGYEGKDCKTDKDECKQNPCPKNRACVNTPGSFKCICLKGYKGEECSGEEVPKDVTPPIIKDYNKKRIAIPHKTPIKTIRKPIYSHDARHKELAGLAIGMIFFYGLGAYLYWRERKKRVEARKAETKETSQSNEENVENEGSILSAQETEVEFKGIGGQGSSKNQELNTRDESFQAYRQQELEKLLEDDTNSRVLEDSKTEPGHEEQKICGETIRDSKSLEELDKINENLPKSESVLTREDMENAEINSANTRGMTNSGAISAPEEEEEETGKKLVQETGTKLVQDNHKSNDVEVVSSNGERESIVTMTRDQTAMDIEVNSGNEDNAE